MFNKILSKEREQIERDKKHLKELVQTINEEREQVLEDIDIVKDIVNNLLKRYGGKEELKNKYYFLYTKIEESFCTLNNHKNYLKRDHIKNKDAKEVLTRIFKAKQDIAVCKEFSFRLKENILIDKNN